MKHLAILIRELLAVVLLAALAWLLVFTWMNEPPEKPPRPMSNVTGTVVYKDRYCYVVSYDDIESRFEHNHQICFAYNDPRFN